MAKFRVYDSLFYANKPASSTLGMKEIKAVGKAIWKDGYESTDPTYIKNVIVPYIKDTIIPSLKTNTPKFMYVDVEGNRPFAPGNNVDDAITNYQAILKAFQDGLPKTKIGLYSIAPVRNPTPWIDTDKWEAKNDAVAPILKYSDYSMPSLYTFTDNQQDWVKYAVANIQEAKQYGKPVIPFLWPQYAEGMGSKTYDFIEPDFWETQLKTVQKYADGVVLYGRSGTGSTKFTFDTSDPWWHVTAKFIGGKALKTITDPPDPDPVPDPDPDPDPTNAHDIVMEAEDMKLGGGYRVETKFSAFASGGANIAIYKAKLGTAEGTFTGDSGKYTITLAGWDQNAKKGVSSVDVFINNKLIKTVVYDNNNNGKAQPHPSNFFEKDLGHYDLQTGDEIELQSVRSGQEWSRVDYVAFDVWS